MLNEILKPITNFSPISLNEMDSVSLMKRSDTKFIVPIRKLSNILDGIQNGYRILEINSKRVMPYSSMYFDTEEQKFYHDHHNGKINRLKVRMRKYVGSNLCFLEVKQKDGKGNTTKSRIKIEDFEAEMSEKSKGFIGDITKENYSLTPVLVNNFNRVTFVSNELKERVTIDFNLNYKSESIKSSFENIAIVEVKQEGVDRSSAVIKELKKNRILPYSISKYCIGMISLYNTLKYNRFKEKLMKINKLSA
jgi:hypothetical protein